MAEGIIKGTIWSGIQRFGSLAIGFISNIVLARLLCPEDFGAMAMVMVFVGIADTIVDGGLGNALIQKKEIEDIDIKTVFSSNLVFSILLFVLFFLIAPLIEEYTNINNLAVYIRVEAFQLFFRALYVIPFSLMQKKFEFARLARINIIASSLSVVTAISFALFGYGIWSLILKNLSLDFYLLILYAIIGPMNYKIGFGWKSFKKLFSFGFFVVLANLFETLYSNLVSFFVGKKYAAKELGYYNQAHALQQIPTYSITAVLNQVLFPYFSNLQESRENLESKLRLSLQMMTFFVFPLLLFLICFAEQIITILYSSKWLPSVPYFQLLCIGGLLNAMIHINRSYIKAAGRTKVIFIIQVLSTVIGIILLYVGLCHSMIMGMSALAFNGIILYIMTASISGKESNYSIFRQLLDVSPNMVF
ncbi:MAG: lipopolysaccharide biosynthesis protein, partial [Prevotella sp.]